MNWHSQPGEREFKIQLQQRALTTNEFNEQVELWPPSGGTETSHWVGLKQDQGDEGLEGGQVVSFGRVFFRGLWQEFKNVTPKDYRIVWNGQVHDILSHPVRLGFNNLLEIKTEARDNQ